VIEFSIDVGYERRATDVCNRMGLLGLIAGFIASKIVSGAGQGFFLNIVLGVIGALVGGWIFRLFGETGLTGFSLYSMFIAIVGAVIVLVVYHVVRGVTA
jgi:uncharacterized membrane protein YeaQ/YmgE (transglycosylase-associated protein family)